MIFGYDVHLSNGRDVGTYVDVCVEDICSYILVPIRALATLMGEV